MARDICSSPLSSADEADDAASSGFLEPSPSPVAPRDNVRVTGGKWKPKAKRTGLPNKKQKPILEWKSSKELIHDAPQEFVEYLTDQLSIMQQTKFETEFGGGQGYIVKLPGSSWKTKRKRDELESWIRALGFTSGATLKRNVLRIASLKVDVILSELKLRMPSIEGGANAEDADMEPEPIDDSVRGNDEKEQGGDFETDPALIRLKKYFKKLESQKLEVVSFTENHRLLSSTQHTAIANAMEDVLAQPSVRRDRRLARRMTKLGRVSGHRLSSIGLVSSSFLPLVEDDWVWDRESEMSLSPVKRRISHEDISSAERKNVLGQNVLHLVLYSGLVDVTASKEVLRKVSTMWEKIAVMAYAWTITDYFKKANLYASAQLYSRHPCGHYLSDGALKEVFKVFSSEQKRLEAVSVMDIGDISNQDAVRLEVAHSVLLSDACEHGICPNFLRVYEVFLAHERPHPARWGSKTHRKPVELLTSGNANLDGPESPQKQTQTPLSDDCERLFQYMRMEFCDGGDLEDFISLQENKALPLESVAVPFFFQMVFSLYCAREKFNLRHYDIKLLNFFLKDIGRSDLTKAPGRDAVLHYMLENACFVLQMPASFSYWVKLADYGAADSSPENLGKPVTIDHFATLENAPIEFLLEGDAAEQSYAADTFSLGLCLLHLFTGSAPYEEILEAAKCPAELLKDLKTLWMNPRKNSKFSVIKKVAHGDDENTLYHALYRFIVLFGLPAENPSESKGIDKVWKLLIKHLRPEDSATKRPQRKCKLTASATKAQLHSKTAKEQFDHDQALYSIASGSDDIIYRCREGLMTIPGAMGLLKQLVDFNPSKRPTLKQVMYHPMFSSLRSPSKQKQIPADFVISYYKSQTQGGRTVLDV
ncbi:serine/threonine protein kinase [Phytophthora nicotianae]|uniref:Serine/threonine protein kinase n=2 Tax=Phytophthora nicotianae TaxID=4792 RepID=W2IHC2_PHYNI|nr:serine/threonine protein kinase [Phytophthora nicotianae]